MGKGVRRVADIASSYTQQVVYAVVGLLVTRVLVRQLGLDVYGSIYFLLQFGAIVGIFGNALTGAAARYATQSIARGERARASGYISNTLFAVAAIGLLSMAGFSAYGMLVPSFRGAVPLLLMDLVLVSLTVASLANVLAVGTFIRERFVSRAGANILGKLVYFGAIWGSLHLLSAGIWSVGWAQWIGATVTLVAFHYLCRRLLPDVSLSLSLISGKQMLEIVAFVGWMLAAYCGMYATRSGMLLAIEHNCSASDLGRFSVAFQVNTMLVNLLQTFSLLAAPGVYRALAIGGIRRGTAGMERYLLRVTLVGAVAALALGLEGENLLRLWLGEAASSGMRMLLVGASFSAFMLAWGTGISVFLAGSNRVRVYGIVCLVTGITVMTVTFVLLHADPKSLVYVAFLPGAAELAKFVVHVFIVDREAFRLAPLRAYTRKGSELLLVLVASLVIWRIAMAALSGDEWWQVIFRILAIGVPMAGYMAWKYRRQIHPIRAVRLAMARRSGVGVQSASTEP